MNCGRRLRGSQRWLQLVVNRHPEIIDGAISSALNLAGGDSIQWLSPLESDNFTEYRDQAFLTRLGIDLPRRRLSDFWPQKGPLWDGLARTGSGRCLLVEAKGNIAEFDSTPSGASGSSLRRIMAALEETRTFLKVHSDTDWSKCFYQYANRLAHLYLLKELNGFDAALVYVYFVGDNTVSGQSPVTRDGWEAATGIAVHHLGISRNSPWMRSNVFDIFINVDELSGIPWQ